MSSHFGEQCLNSSHFRIVRSLFRRLAKYFSDDWRKDRGTEAEASPFLAAAERKIRRPARERTIPRSNMETGGHHSPMAEQAGFEPAITAIAVAFSPTLLFRTQPLCTVSCRGD